MTTITGIFRGGRVELDGPPPDWEDGSRVTVAKPQAAVEAIDITGDSPEAIAAWIVHFDELHASVEGSAFPDELERILAESKAQELARWDEHGRRSEGLCP